MHGKRMRRSPIKNVLDTIKNMSVKKLLTKAATPVIGATTASTLGVGGAALGLLEGYGNLSKQKHGNRIIKDARQMPGKI